MFTPTTRRQILKSAAAIGLSTTVAAPRAWAQKFPNRPVRLVTSGGPGSVPDTLARLLGEHLAAKLGQAVVVDGRPGPGGIAAIQSLQASEPDGHTIALATIAQAVFNSYLFSSLPYDPFKDLVPVSKIAAGAMAIAVSPSRKTETLAQLVAAARSEPGSLLVGTPAYGTPPHLVALKLMHATGMKATFVPFKTGPDAVLAALRGDIHVVVDGPTIIVPHVRAEALKAIAVTSRTRIAELADVPTVSEGGFAGAQAETWFGLMVRSGTPRSIVDDLGDAVRSLFVSSPLPQKLAALSFMPQPTTAEEFAATVRAEHEQWGPVIRQAGLKPI